MKWRSLDTDAPWIAAAAGGTMIVALAFAQDNPSFLTRRNLDNIAYAGAPLLLLVAAQMLLLRARHLEPALLGVATLVGTLAVCWNVRQGMPFGFAVLLALALVALPFGVLNGLLSSWLTAPAALAVSIGTFASMTLVATIVIGAGASVSVDQHGEFARLARENIGGFPAIAVVALVVCAIVAVVSNLPGLTRHDVPAGAAVWIALYSFAAVVSGLAGILAAVRLQSVSQADDATLQEAQVIAALLVGGASLYGGRGGAGSALAGSAFVAVMVNGAYLTWSSPNISTIVFAVCGLVSAACFILDYTTRDRAAVSTL